MGRHRFDEKDEHVKWGGPALAEGSAQPARGQDDDSAIRQLGCASRQSVGRPGHEVRSVGDTERTCRNCEEGHDLGRVRTRTSKPAGDQGVRIVLAAKEPIGLALRRLKKLLEQLGATWELRRRRYFIKPSQARRAKRFQKRFKARKATLLAKSAGEQPVSSVSESTQTLWKKTGKP